MDAYFRKYRFRGHKTLIKYHEEESIQVMQSEKSTYFLGSIRKISFLENKLSRMVSETCH
jgi:hypothetical protein